MNNVVKTSTLSVVDITQDSGSWDGGSIPSGCILTFRNVLKQL